MSTKIFSKTYDGEDIVDAYRDISEAFDERFTPVLTTIPRDEHGFHQGVFKVRIEWCADDEVSVGDDARRLDWVESAASAGRLEIARSLLGSGFEFGFHPSGACMVKSGTLREAIDGAMGEKA